MKDFELIKDLIERKEYFEVTSNFSKNNTCIKLYVDCCRTIDSYIEYLSYYKKYEKYYIVTLQNIGDEGLTLNFFTKE